jgi:hypothetical protein
LLFRAWQSGPNVTSYQDDFWRNHAAVIGRERQLGAKSELSIRRLAFDVQGISALNWQMAVVDFQGHHAQASHVKSST